MLGPTAVLLLHRLARYLTAAPQLNFETVELAASLGLATSDRLATSAGFNRTMQRLEMFGMIRTIGTIGTTIHVRIILPPLAQRHQRLLPNYLRTSYPWAVNP